MSRTFVILVNWNGGADSVECLESLRRLKDQDFSVIIVDNGSADDSIARIADWAQSADAPRFEGAMWAAMPPRQPTLGPMVILAPDHHGPLPDGRLFLIPAGCNLGFAAANNLAMRIAANDRDAAYFWILNNDTVVSPDALSIQTARMAGDPCIGILGARLMFYDCPDQVQGVAGGFHYWRARGYHIGAGLTVAQLPDEAAVERRMAYPMGASMFVRRALFETIGGMSEAYFLYFEEIDWVRRIEGKFRIAVTHEAVIWHKEGGSIGSSSRARPSDTGLYYLSAGLLRFYIVHFISKTPLALCRIVREAVSLALKGDHRGVHVMGVAIADVVRGRQRRGHYGSDEFRSAR